MRGLPTLIRLAKHDLDERRRTLAELQDRQDRFRVEAALTEARLEGEKLNAREAGQVAFAFTGFMHAALAERDRLLAEAERMNPEVDAALEVVRAAYEEVKRLEMVEEAERLAERERLEKLERQALDEAGMDRHVRARREAGSGE